MVRSNFKLLSFALLFYLEQRLLHGGVVLHHDEIGQAPPENIPWVDAGDPLERARSVPELRTVVQAVDRHHVGALFHNEAEHLSQLVVLFLCCIFG